MSAEVSRLYEDPTSPEAWGERTVATVSVSPWYRLPNGNRLRTVNLTCANSITWERIEKRAAEPWIAARKRTEQTVRKMLRQMTDQIAHLGL